MKDIFSFFEPLIEFLVPFAEDVALDEDTIEQRLRAFDVAMAGATCAAGDSERFGASIGWGDHIINLETLEAVHVDAIERCVRPAHYDADLKNRARAHRMVIRIKYAGRIASHSERYLATAAVAFVLGELGALIVAHPAARTSLPARMFAGNRDANGLTLLRALPLPMLFAGVTKYDCQDGKVWMRSYGGQAIRVPNLAYLADGHGDGEATVELFDYVMRYVIESGVTLHPGETISFGDRVMRFAPGEEMPEEIDDDDHDVLVLQPIAMQ